MNRSRPAWSTATAAPPSSRLVVAGDLVAIPAAVDGGDGLVALRRADGEVAWRAATPDLHLASALARVLVAAGDDTVYLAQGGHVAAVAVGDGAVRWSRLVPAAPPFEDFSIDHEPAVDATHLYLLSRHARLIAVDRATGALAWRANDLDSATSLALVDGVVVTRSAERAELRAFVAATGALVWSRQLIDAPVARPLEAGAVAVREAARAGVVLMVDGDHTVTALEAATGEVRWELPIVSPVTWAWAGRRLVVCDEAEVRGVDVAAGVVTWKHPTGGAARVAPLDDELVLVATGDRIAAVDAATGSATTVAHHTVTEQARVVAAGFGGAVLTTDGGHARWYQRRSGGVDERDLGPLADGPRARGGVLVQVELTADGAVTLDGRGEIARLPR
ncbi:MAG: PQQ-binding-like beta-propeller repeat protein [Kofleriaceae bacterium]